MTIARRGHRCTTFRDGSTDGQGRFVVLRCDGCQVTAEMVRKDEHTLTSSPGWEDEGEKDYCPRCAGARRAG